MTQEPGGLQSMGSQRVGHDWETDTYFNIYYPGVLEEITESLQTEKVIKIFEQTLISSKTRYQKKNKKKLLFKACKLLIYDKEIVFLLTSPQAAVKPVLSFLGQKSDEIFFSSLTLLSTQDRGKAVISRAPEAFSISVEINNNFT